MPEVSGPVAWVADCDGKLSRFWMKTGKRQWSSKAPKGIHGAPVLAGGVVAFGCDDGHVYAVDAVSGDKQWQVRPRRAVYATGCYAPALGTARLPTLVIGSLDGTLLALDPATGAERWRYESRASIAAEVRRHGGKLYVACMNGKVHRLSEDGVHEGTLELKGQLCSLSAVDALGCAYTTGYEGILYKIDLGRLATVWSAPTGRMPACVPVADGSRVYVTAWDRKLYAYDQATGARAWVLAGAQRFYNSPMLHDGLVYAGCDDGTLYCLEPARGWVHWTYKLSGSVRTEMRVTGTGTLLVGTQKGHLYCLELPARSALGEPTAPPAPVVAAPGSGSGSGSDDDDAPRADGSDGAGSAGSEGSDRK